MTRAALGDLVTLHYGKNLPEKKRRLGGVPVFGSNGVVGRHDEALVERPTIVVGRKGSVGALHKTNQPCWPIDTTFFVEITDPERLSLDYLYYALSQINLKRHSIVVGVPGINRADIYNEQVALPPISEQRRIVDILDRAAAIQKLRRQAEAKAQEIIPALFVDMFGDPATNPKGWPVSTVEALAQVQGGIQVAARRDALPLKRPYLRVANVYRGRLDLTEIKMLGVTEAEAARSRLETGDVLVVEGHGNANEVGRAAVWDGSIVDCIHQNHLIRIRPDQSVLHPTFLEAFLNSQSGRQSLIQDGKTTSGLNTISTKNVKNVKIVAPPVSLQREFGSRIAMLQAVAATGGTAAARIADLQLALSAQVMANA